MTTTDSEEMRDSEAKSDSMRVGAISDSQAASDSEAASRVGPGPYGPLCIYGWGAGGLLPEAGVKRQEGRDGGCRRGIARRAGVDWRRRAALPQ